MARKTERQTGGHNPRMLLDTGLQTETDDWGKNREARLLPLDIERVGCILSLKGGCL